MKDLYKENKESLINKYKKIRSWTIASAVVNALLILLIVFACIFGSNTSNSVVAENENKTQLVRKNLIDNDYTLYSYDCVYNATDYTFDETFQSQLSEKCNSIVNVSTSYGSVQDVKNYVFNFTGDAYLRNLDDNSLSPVSSFCVSFATFPHPNNILYRYRLNYIYFGSDNGSYVLCYKTDTTSYDNYNYHFYPTSYRLVTSQNEIDDLAFKQFYVLYGESSTFTFNKQFNYNAPLGTTIDGVYGSGSFTYVGSDTAYNIYDVGYFVSNGQLFNQIKVWYIETGAVDVYMQNDSGTYGIRRAPSGYYVYMFMEYNNTDSNTGLIVNYHDQIPFITSGGGSTYYYANSSTWKNDAFRQVVFLQTLSDSNIVSINAFNNNNQNSTSGYVGAGDMTNVFTLVSSVFTGILPILNMAILPGITLGVLLFVPLVALLVFAIIRIIKK